MTVFNNIQLCHFNAMDRDELVQQQEYSYSFHKLDAFILPSSVDTSYPKWLSWLGRRVVDRKVTGSNPLAG